jgi:hypothetical protein
MKHHLILLAASVALFAGSSQAGERQTADNSSLSGEFILAQASGGTGGSTGSGSTSGGGSADPGQIDPRQAPPNAPGGPRGAGGTAAEPSTTGSIPATPPAVGNNNAGSGGSSTDTPIDPRATPPNAPAAGR